ncbi:hypothetical protein M8J75_004574 [Diaphorina citri]|nr:hypothetical protein M8J75_004574 [Diaphorina citri]
MGSRPKIKMNPALWSADNLSSDEEEEEGSKRDLYDTGRRMFSFVIDAKEAMFNNSDKFILMSLKAIRNILMKCVRESKTDLISIVLFNTNDITSTNFEHITNFIPLGDLNAEKIIKLEKLIESHQLDEIKKYVCDSNMAATLSSKNVLKNTLWHCQSLVEKISHHCIVMFTPVDFPKEDYKLVLQQANDMGTQKKTRKFNYSSLYKEVLVRANNLSSDEWTDPGEFNTVESIVNAINTHKNAVRCFRRLNLCLGDGLEIKMAAYNIIRGRTGLSPASTYVSREDNQTVQSSTVLETKNDGELVLPNEVSYSTKVKGEAIHFSSDERSHIQGYQAQGIHILGFIPASLLKPHHQAGHSAFLVPATPEGHQPAGLLLQKCAALGRVALCSVVYAKMGKPRLAALLPHLSDGKYPNGFLLKPLPYSDEIRTEVLSIVSPYETAEAEKKERTVMNLIKSFLNPDFQVGSLRDPKLDTEWAALEALALQRSDMEPVFIHSRNNRILCLGVIQKPGLNIQHFKK